MRSRRFGAQQNALLDNLQERMASMEARLEEVKSSTSDMLL